MPLGICISFYPGPATGRRQIKPPSGIAKLLSIHEKLHPLADVLRNFVQRKADRYARDFV